MTGRFIHSNDSAMKTALKNLTVDQLVDRFAEFGIAQDDALWDGKYAKFNGLFDQMMDVNSQLQSHSPEARLALTRLFDHRNIQVRLQAARS